MRGFAKGLIVGASVTLVGAMGFAYGQSKSVPTAENEANAFASCQVRVGNGQFQGGYQCQNNRVMVGALNGQILCADLQVICP